MLRTDMYYMDCNGDIWVPCFCGEGGGTGGTGETAGASGHAEEEIPDTEGRPQYIPDRSGAFVQVNYPAEILYYDGQTFSLDGRQYD